MGFRLTSFRSLALFPRSVILLLLNLSDWQTQHSSRSFTHASTWAQRAGTDITLWSMPLIFCCFLLFNNRLHKTCSKSGLQRCGMKQREQTVAWIHTHSNDKADGRYAGRGHDFSTVGDEIKQRGHDGLGSVVKLVTQHRRQMPG